MDNLKLNEMSEPKSNSETNEMEDLIDDRNKKHEIVNNDCEEKEEDEHFIKKENFDVEKSTDDYEIKIWRKKIIMNKSLFSFRLVQFMWFGAGSIPSIFLGIFLKQRGLTLVELSSVYSMIFLFQLISSFITGIITDKIGNAKPVLLFLMFSSALILVFMSLIPNVNSGPCTQLEKNLNFTSEKSQNFSSCFIKCLHKNGKHQVRENYTEISDYENTTLSKRFELLMDNDKTSCNFSMPTFTNSSYKLLRNDCCDMCSNHTKIDCIKERKRYLVVVYAILILIFYAFWNTSYRFLDFSAVSLAAKNKSHFGKERMFAISGSLLMLIIIAFALNIDKSSDSAINFDPVMWIAVGLKLIAILTTLFTIKVPILPPAKNLMKKAFSLLKDTDILAFVLIVFIAGNGFAFNFTLHLVFLETINAPSIVVSLHSVALYLYGFPIAFTSKWWLKKFGANKLFVLGLLSYTVNNTAYSYTTNSWWSLLIDINIVFTLHLFWISIVTHCRNVAPVGFAATLNALTGAVHYGIGRSSGVFFGGMLMNYAGPRKSYRIMAAVFFTTAVLYSIFLFTRRKSHPVNVTSDDDKDEEKEYSKNADITVEC